MLGVVVALKITAREAMIVARIALITLGICAHEGSARKNGCWNASRAATAASRLDRQPMTIDGN
ncbi:hypothetical protein [Paraburkholderia sp. BR14374]|uniref:hypothetical protein n=1 Tax=Paraburkholderia sp. BR14374 TaxID=3237007 RepID=UPI0034CE8513